MFLVKVIRRVFTIISFLAILFTRVMTLTNVLILKNNVDVMLCSSSSACSVEDEKTFSQRYEEAARIIVIMIIITVKVKNQNQFTVLLD
jgi:hypothetical protein